MHFTFNQHNPVHILKTHFYKLHFNIILQSVFKSLKPSPVFTLSTKILYVFLMCPFTSHSPPISTLHHSMPSAHPAIPLSCMFSFLCLIPSFGLSTASCLDLCVSCNLFSKHLMTADRKRCTLPNRMHIGTECQITKQHLAYI